MSELSYCSTRRAVSTYVITSILLAAAWHVTFAYGLWIVNAIAGCVGVGCSVWTLGGRTREVLAWSKRNAVAGVGFGMALVLATEVAARVLLPLVPIASDETHRLYALLRATLPAPNYAPIIGLVVLAEEMVYRGVVTQCLLRTASPIWIVVLATFLYTLPLALSGSWLLVLMGLSLGACWTIGMAWSRSLLVPLLAHLIWSFATFVVFPIA